jgi:hypothetical protein
MTASADASLVEDMIRLAGQAVADHSGITGDQNAHENFIRNQVAIGLYHDRKTSINMEVGREGFIKAVEEKKRGAFARITAEQWRNLFRCDRSHSFKIDLVVWHPTYPHPDYPMAIIEMKKGQNFENDAKSISHLLSYCSPETPGYMVECLICREEQLCARKTTLRGRIQTLNGVCGEPTIGRPQQLAGTHVWCMTSVIPILRSGDAVLPI